MTSGLGDAAADVCRKMELQVGAMPVQTQAQFSPRQDPGPGPVQFAARGNSTPAQPVAANRGESRLARGDAD